MGAVSMTNASRNAPHLAYRRQGWEEGLRAVAEEVPVAISYNGSTQAVMMATPADLEDFAVGFSLTESIVDDPAEIESLEVVAFAEGIDVQLRLAERPEQRLAARRRLMAGPVGCGLCGIDSIDNAMRPLTPLENDDIRFTAGEICDAMDRLAGAQRLNAQTRAVHGAGLYVPGEGLVAAREDVGRHNALDKLVGALARSGAASRGPRHGLAVITSRISVEMVQKAVRLRTPVLAAISAPTALAIRTAEEANLTLVALVRGEEFDVYTHRGRIVAD